MKRNFLLIFVLCTLCCNVSFAQVINGDLNHNNTLDVGDVTLVIDGYLTGETELIQTGGAPFSVDNSYVVGTWYTSASENITFNADGTTNFANGGTYEFLPTQGYILFYNASGVPTYAMRVLKATSDYLVVLPTGSNVPVRYTNTQPISITLSQTSVEMKPDEFVRLTATVDPTSAGTVTWSSSDESVATVVSGFVTAVAEGTAVITATVAGRTAACTVTVTSASPVPTHEAVDLGLSVKWATMNIGANAPEEYGDYFAWGETTAKDTYNWSTYKWCNESPSGVTMTKYCTRSSYGTVDNKTILDLSDDAANANWGGTWRMPTDDELTELRTQCTWTWTTQNGTKGYKVTSKSNDNSIFLPAAGFRYGTSLSDGSGGYWSSSVDSSIAWKVSFNAYGLERSNGYRYLGLSVRAVCE
ncbi:MAG: Ig-like domain-containing protein [Bacteroidaceae bacterium]|nr:Ig-like domain-containing protein [Bacteroidaceae bacterium]